MLRCFDWLETDEWNLHGAEQSNDEERVVSDVDPLRISIHQQKHKHVQGDEIDNENVSSPGRHLHKQKRKVVRWCWSNQKGSLHRDSACTQHFQGFVFDFWTLTQ